MLHIVTGEIHYKSSPSNPWTRPAQRNELKCHIKKNLVVFIGKKIPIDLAQNVILFGAKLIWKVWLRSKFANKLHKFGFSVCSYCVGIIIA